MKPVTLQTLATWCDAAPIGTAAQISCVVSDSREVRPGALFVALRGERVDGHDFLEEAKARGAVAALVEHQVAVDLPQLVVRNGLLALGQIASAVRLTQQATVLALTGSNGKTSVKTLTHAILSRVAATYANPGNRNNELGMPLALLAQPDDVRFAIYEMGAGAPGDIGYLAEIARPHVALVNNIGPAHLERLGSLLGVAETKGAIYTALPANGTAVINADDAFGPWFEQRLRGQRVLRFALAATAEISAEDIDCGPESSRFLLRTPAGDARIQLPLAGRHNISNALAATGLALGAGAPLDAVVAGLEAAPAVSGRLQRHQLDCGAVLIDDSYNANPASAAAAIATLSAHPGRRILVLGDMRELGLEAEKLHGEVGAKAKAAGIDALYTVGELARHAADAFGTGARHCATQDELVAALRGSLGAGCTVLVKGSRGSRMDRVAAALLPATGGSHAA